MLRPLTSLPALVALPLVVILLLGTFRELLGFAVAHGRAVYLSYFILGAVLMVGGFLALRARHNGESA